MGSTLANNSCDGRHLRLLGLSVDIYILYIEICWQKKSLRCIFLGTITAMLSSFSIFKIYRKLTEMFKGLKKVCNTVYNIFGSMMI